jgi:DNA-binding transcriptional MerR regulator
MPWSTREVAELAGTTVNAVRHYHALGILDEPERASNGYKQYGSEHLLQLVYILRQRSRGVPAAEIGRDDENASELEMLRVIETDISESIDRLQRSRAEIRVMLRALTVGEQ